MTATEINLLAAILAEPDKDDLRLIYADYLDEQAGEPTERAEFIRVQVELAIKTSYRRDLDQRSNVLQVKWDERLGVLLKRERELLEDHAHDWARPSGLEGYWCWNGDTLADGNGAELRLSWSRGFVSMVKCSCQVWLDHGKAIVRAHPVQTVRLTDKEPYRAMVPAGAAWISQDGSHVARYNLPSSLWKFLKGETIRLNVDPKASVSYQASTEAALTDLSNACLCWARLD